MQHPADASPPTTAVIVGVQSEPLNGAIDSIRLVTELNGATHSDESFGPDALPHEVKLLPPNGDVSAVVGAKVSGFLGTVGPQPLLLRTAETGFAPGQTVLLRILLQGPCLLPLPGLMGGAPSCMAPQTCVDGACKDDHVSPQDLETYVPSWAASTPDICKPANAGPPVLQMGTGQTDYLPLNDGDTLQAEQGPQGGHHIWIAVRQRNLKQSGCTTTITSVQPGGLVGPRSSFAFVFEPDQGGFCKLFGLRYQLDSDGTDYHLFLGQPLDVTVTIADSMTGESGSAVAHINVAPQALCSNGTSGSSC